MKKIYEMIKSPNFEMATLGAIALINMDKSDIADFLTTYGTEFLHKIEGDEYWKNVAISPEVVYRYHDIPSPSSVYIIKNDVVIYLGHLCSVFLLSHFNELCKSSRICSSHKIYL